VSVQEAVAPRLSAPAANPPRWRVEALPIAFVTLQLVVFLLLARAFEIEHASFYDLVLPLAIGGFVVHHWLPRKLQTWFFVALSVAGIFLVFGAQAGGWLLGVALTLIGLCHVPVAFRWRVLLVLAAAGVLVAMRASWLAAPWPGAIWPILASMFMFRLGIYLYDLKHQTRPAGAATVLSYFLMLPNTVFLLFPVIDWQTFRRTYFDKPALDIYREGVRWIFRGLLHLVFYRVIYQNWAIAPEQVTTTAQLVQYLVANFGLYLRVSGQFHLIIGLLHLFGFRLPESHRFFYLASSFTDLWRRINIYWKDFMQKMVYLPVVMSVQMKRRSETTKLVVATVAVVVITWTLHSYQWFWLLGTWLISGTDTAFWGLIGACLIASTLLEQRRGRVRQLTAKVKPGGWRHALQTAAMFATMTLLWGLWTAPTFPEFGALLSAATWRGVDVAVVLGVLGTVALAAWVTQRFSLDAPTALGHVRRGWQHPLVTAALPLGCFWLAGADSAATRMPAPLHELARNARSPELNDADAVQMQRGYYEEIVGVNRFNGELWEVYARQGEQQAPLIAAEGGQFVDDGYGNRSYRPHASVDQSKRGITFTINRWGLRDQEYEKKPAGSTRRIAIFGPSLVLGAGVSDGEPFEAVLEERLNRELSPQTGLHYEVLNFGLPRATLSETATIIASGRAEEFEPDVIFLVGHVHALPHIENELAKRLEAGEAPPPVLSQVVPDDALEPGLTETAVKRRLYLHGEALLRAPLELAADAARRMGAQPVFATIPMPLEELDFPRGHDPVALAREAGFIAIDLRDVYDGQPRELLILTDEDHHPNAQGNRVIAERLWAELVGHPSIVGEKR
jgi:D-alanyl-lipoteichoic acid acyltransferase DltB (MBOAT superfamily)